MPGLLFGVSTFGGDTFGASAVVVSGLTGHGQITVDRPVAVLITLSGIPISQDTALGYPVRYFHLGNVAWGAAGGFARNYYLEHQVELVPAPFVGATVLAYSFAPGLTAEIAELASL